MGGSEAIRCRLIATAVICLAIGLTPACGDDQKAGLSIGRASPTASPLPEATAFPSSTPEPAQSPADGSSFTLAAVGDIMLGRSVGEAIDLYGPGYPFEQVAAALSGGDVTFGNLEAPITARGLPAPKDYVFRAPPEAAQGLASAGLDVVSLANNHAMDYGVDGLRDTLAALRQAGVAFAGAGENEASARQPAVLTVAGLRVAFLGYVQVPDDSISGFGAEGMAAGSGRAGVAWASPEGIAADVEAAAQAADLVVVSLHTGFEYQEAPSALQRELAHAAVDAGADLVLGHHPHVLQGLESYRGALIAYSLGNFVFDFDETDYAHPGLPSAQTLILEVTLGPEGVRDVEMLPVRIDPQESRPYLAEGDEADAVRQRMERLSPALTGQ